MEFYLLALRSLTYAQRGREVLAGAGIRAGIVKTPAVVSPKGCSHSLKLKSRDAQRGVQVLRSEGVKIEKIFAATAAGNFLEVTL